MDPQDHAYYLAERRAFGLPIWNESVMTLDEHEDQILESGLIIGHDEIKQQVLSVLNGNLWRHHVKLDHLHVKVCDVKTPKFTRCYWDSDDSTIRIPCWAMMQQTVIHEMAHILHEAMAPDDDEHHGLGFIHAMVWLTAEQLGGDRGAKLFTELLKQGHHTAHQLGLVLTGYPYPKKLPPPRSTTLHYRRLTVPGTKTS